MCAESSPGEGQRRGALVPSGSGSRGWGQRQHGCLRLVAASRGWSRAPELCSLPGDWVEHPPCTLGSERWSAVVPGPSVGLLQRRGGPVVLQEAALGATSMTSLSEACPGSGGGNAGLSQQSKSWGCFQNHPGETVWLVSPQSSLPAQGSSLPAQGLLTPVYPGRALWQALGTLTVSSPSPGRGPHCPQSRGLGKPRVQGHKAEGADSASEPGSMCSEPGLARPVSLRQRVQGRRWLSCPVC